MFEGHNPYLVALSVVIAILGGYTGFGLAARVRSTFGAARRFLLAGAALFLAVGIWTMHFVGVLAAPIPGDAVYLVLPTIVSFLICALVVGVSMFFVSVGEPSNGRIAASALLLGAGVVTMHYVGIHALAGPFHVEHRPAMVVVAGLIAVGTAYGGLRIYLARQGGMRLALSAIAFGFAASGMHYTAMYGMRFEHAPSHMDAADGLVATAQVVSLVVAMLCFIVIAGFLLFLVPEQRPQIAAVASAIGGASVISQTDDDKLAEPGRASRPIPRLPVEEADGTHFLDAADIRSVRADAHYTLVHDGSRERMCPWSISAAEAQLDPSRFLRVHRSHIVSISHVTVIRKEGDGAIVEMDGPSPHLVPVSRAKIAELKARLGLLKRTASNPSAHRIGQSN